MRFRLRRIRKPQVFALLMIASALFILMPRDYFGPARNLVQLVAYGPQKAGSGAAHFISDEIKDLGAKSVPANEHEKMRLHDLGLQNENVSLRRQLDERDSLIASLTRLRKYDDLKQGVIIPAAVIALDAAGGRESLLLGTGRLSDIRRKDWVTSRLLLDGGDREGLRSQSPVLARECLIGWVEDVSPVNARVVLLSDPVSNRGIPVRVMRDKLQHDPKKRWLSDNGRNVSFTLEGAGNGRMRMIDVFHDYYEKKEISPGDWVVSERSPKLPDGIVIGRIERFDQVKQKPVYFTATVAPIFDPQSLDEVYVVDLSRSPAVAR